MVLEQELSANAETIQDHTECRFQRDGMLSNEALSSRRQFYAKVPVAPPDPILGVSAAFRADTRAEKVDVSIGAFRDEQGLPWVLPAVRKAERKIVNEMNCTKEYLPLEGLEPFRKAMAQLLYCPECRALVEKRIAVCQSISGTGALRLSAEFIAAHFPQGTQVFIPAQTWGNHFRIYGDAGLTTKTYRYYNPSTLGLDFAGLCEDLQAAPLGSVVVLHMCAHNPTGVDPTQEQWNAIATICENRELFAVFDCAYQGLASGDPQTDAYAVRLFEKRGLPLCAAQSCSKNFGLYGERAGAVSFVCPSQQEATAVLSQLKLIARAMYASCPQHGAMIVATILQDSELTEEWDANVRQMAHRIQRVRQLLYDALQANACPGSWAHVLEQCGMFTYSGLTPAQSRYLTETHHIYLTMDGRISMAGLNGSNVAYVAEAIKDAVTNA